MTTKLHGHGTFMNQGVTAGHVICTWSKQIQNLATGLFPTWLLNYTTVSVLR